jgi:hypothetical protein
MVSWTTNDADGRAGEDKGPPGRTRSRDRKTLTVAIPYIPLCRCFRDAPYTADELWT